MHTAFRMNASQLFRSPSLSHPTSAAAHLGTHKRFTLALDGPGIPSDPFAFPLAWSSKNYIAVACGTEVYFQNLDTREILNLCWLTESRRNEVHCIEWGGQRWQDTLALGTTEGTVQLWDATECRRIGLGTQVRKWKYPPDKVGGISWHGNMLTVGRSKGTITLFDVRMRDIVRIMGGHKSKVCGLKWSDDGNFMASGDHSGGVLIWDARAGKSLSEGLERRSKMKHSGPVKVWCLCHDTRMPHIFIGSGMVPLEIGLVCNGKHVSGGHYSYLEYEQFIRR
jgi:cell division cycle protein 20 (cofactor of APC complex)